MDKLKKTLTTAEIFKLTTGVLGHVTDLEQLHLIKRYIEERIKFLKRK